MGVRRLLSSTSNPSVMLPNWISLALPEKPFLLQIQPGNVEMIREPVQFYNILKEKSSLASKRITLSCLYLGTGDKEQNLVSAIKDRRKENPDLNVTLLFDYTRSSRINKDGTSSLNLLKSLITSSNQRTDVPQDSMSINFFLSPDFSSPFIKNVILPRQKINEVISLQHIKCFIFDDDVIISGANLSDQYFVNRADRYYLFKDSPNLCNFLEDLVKTVSSFSLQMTDSGELTTHADWKWHPLTFQDKKKFIEEAKRRLSDCYSKHQTVQVSSQTSTFVLPLLQMKTFDIEDDATFTQKLLTTIPSDSVIRLASGYFNLTSAYKNSLLSLQSKANISCDVLMASEQVNSFYRSAGLMKFIPSFYTQMSQVFLRQVSEGERKSLISLWTFFKPNWTFHSKGLWIKHDDWMLTTIGSSNFGYRSTFKDLELQLAVVTRDHQLQNSLDEESRDLWSCARPVKLSTDLPKVPLWVRFISPFIKKFF